MSKYASQQATTRASAWTWVGVLVALGGPALAVAAKRSGYFGSDVGSHILNWFALWGAALLTLLILVVGERQSLSEIRFRRFKHQLLISNRSRQRAPNLTTLDRFVLGLTALFVSPRRIAKLGALVKPATLFEFHGALTDRKYRLLFPDTLPRVVRLQAHVRPGINGTVAFNYWAC